jgi:hypothetical protein
VWKCKVGSTALVLARKVREFENEIYNGSKLIKGKDYYSTRILKYTPAPECIIVKGDQDYYFMTKTGNHRFISCIVLSSSIAATARCGLWLVEQYLSIFPYP